MKAKYEDILELARQLEGVTVKPQWYDENGVPRFVEHHPKYAANIYAYEVALVRIQCQSCAKPFLVQFSWSSFNDVQAFNAGKQAQARDSTFDLESYRETRKISGRIKSGYLHYGDPPRHPYTEDDGCAGETMNCDDIAVVEFWKRDKSTGNDWARVPELERALPGATSTEG